MNTIEHAKQAVNLLEYVKNSTPGQIRKVGSDTYRLNPCPICEGKDHFTIYEDSSSYSSFSGCCKGGSIIDYLQEVEGLPEEAAYSKTKELAGIREPDKSDTLKRAKKESAAATAPSVENYREIINNLEPSNYYYSRGLTEKTTVKYNLGKLENGLNPYGSKFKHVIPVSESFIIFRSDDEQDRYRNKGNTEIFNKRYLQDPELTGKYIFITEGVFDALSLYELDRPALALNGTSMADKLIDIIQQNKENLRSKIFILAADNDQAGKNLSDKLQADFNALELELEILWPEGYKDVNEYLQDDREGLKQHIKQFIDEMYNKPMVVNYLVDYIENMEKNNTQQAISTGFEGLDEKIGGGIYPGLYALGAISSLGKTTLVMQIADEMAKSGQDVLFYSLEVSKFEMVSKSLAREMFSFEPTNAAGTRQIMTGDFKGQEHVFKEALELYRNNIASNLAIAEGDFETGITDIYKGIDSMIKHRNKKPVVIIDYLQIIEASDPRLSERQAIDKNVTTLKKISREFDIPVIVVSSFNRANYMEKVGFESFKESGAIEYTADCMIGLQLGGLEEVQNCNTMSEKRERINEMKKRNPRKIELVVLKNRNFSPFEMVEFDYYPKFNYFEEKV